MGIRYVFPPRPLLLPGAVHLTPAAGGLVVKKVLPWIGLCDLWDGCSDGSSLPLCLGTFSLWLDCILSHYYWFGTLG